MDEFDAHIDAHIKNYTDEWDLAADFPPSDWLTYAEAKVILENEIQPNAIHVP